MALPRPLVIAHRGASAEHAEHTHAAVLRAIELGADGIEVDVRLTRDGHLVCIHDAKLDRTSTGRGRVSAARLNDLQRLDFGSWHSGEPSEVLTLVDLLGLIHDTERPLRLLIETKHPTRFGGQVEKTLVEVLARFGWTGDRTARRRRDSPVTVMSFSERALQRIHILAPDLPTVMLLSSWSRSSRVGLLPEGVTIAGPSIELLRTDPNFVDRARALGNRVYLWTVDEPADFALAQNLGIEAVITNRPAELLAAL